jgi:hypothetical protein
MGFRYSVAVHVATSKASEVSDIVVLTTLLVVWRFFHAISQVRNFSSRTARDVRFKRGEAPLAVREQIGSDNQLC